MTKNENRPKDCTASHKYQICIRTSNAKTWVHEVRASIPICPPPPPQLFLSKEIKAEIYNYLFILFYTSTKRRYENKNSDWDEVQRPIHT